MRKAYPFGVASAGGWYVTELHRFKLANPGRRARIYKASVCG